jgi:uncharacterized membrane protein YjjP (DUF1212 family)
VRVVLASRRPHRASRASRAAGAARATEQKRRDLQQFLLYLGSALTAAGEAVNEIEDHLSGVARAYGAPHARFSVLPTYVVASLEPGRPATLEPTGQLRGGLRLDQTSAVFQVLKAAERGGLDLREGSHRIRRIVNSPPRFGLRATILGHLVLTVGICLVLQPTVIDLAVAGLFGILVGLLKRVGQRWTSTRMIMPVGAAFFVAAVTFVLSRHGWADADVRSMVAPLVTFLPGGMLTMAVVELSAGQLVTGASRLVAGVLQLLLLAFGIIAAAQVVGLPTSDELVDDPTNQLGWWAPWLGVLLVGIGSYLYHSAPRRSLGWLCLVLYVAWVGQFVGNIFVGGYLSGFVGALVMTPAAYLVARFPSGPPAMVSFLPAFWLLVPGALGLIGIAEYLGEDSTTGLQDFLGMVGSMIAVALGVLCGYPLYRSLLVSVRGVWRQLS